MHTIWNRSWNNDFSTNSHSTTKRLEHSSNFESVENVRSSNVVEFEFELRHIPIQLARTKIWYKTTDKISCNYCLQRTLRAAYWVHRSTVMVYGLCPWLRSLGSNRAADEPTNHLIVEWCRQPSHGVDTCTQVLVGTWYQSKISSVIIAHCRQICTRLQDTLSMRWWWYGLFLAAVPVSNQSA